MKNLSKFFAFFLLLIAGTSTFAVNLPARNNRYVNDNANVLSSGELSQLRTDVKALCDYYQYQIAVCIVSSFSGLSLDDYAAAVGQKWGVTNAGDNGLLILIKPKSGSENGEAKLLTSSDLSEKLPPSILKKILQQEMLPSLRNNEYYNSVEAALEYLNNLPQMDPNTSVGTTTDNYDNTEVLQEQSQNGSSSGFLRWILLALGAVILIYSYRKIKSKIKNAGASQSSSGQNSSDTQTQRQKPKVGRQADGNSTNSSNTNSRPEMGGRPNMGGRPEMNDQTNMGGQANTNGQVNTNSRPEMGGRPNMGGRPEMNNQANAGGQANTMPYSTENTYSDDPNQSKEDMIREMEAARRSMSNNQTGSSYVSDLNSGLPQDMENELKQYFTGSNGAIDEKTLEEMLKKMASRQGSGTTIFDMAKKALKVAMSVGAGVVVFRALKKIIGASSDPNDDGGLLGKILKGGTAGGTSSTSSGTKPTLGGKKPNFGGGSGEGSSASVSW